MKDFNNLLKEIGLTRKEFAEMIGVTEGSLGVMLSPMKDKEPRPIPKWVTSALIVAKRLKEIRQSEQLICDACGADKKEHLDHCECLEGREWKTK